MVAYRRCLVPGGTFFFTATLADRRATTLTDRIEALRAVFRSTRARHPFQILAVVILPEHLHCVWTLPSGDADFSTRWRLIKSSFSRTIAPARDKGERGVWQPRFWEHMIRDTEDLERHVDYIHFNPAKHGLVKCVGDWPYSSFHRYVTRGWLAPDWAANVDDASAEFGE